jgi:hypothetical protein
VTGAPVANIGPPALKTTQTSPCPVVIVGWSTKRKRPRPSPDALVGVPLGGATMFVTMLNVSPPSVLRATGTVFSVWYRYVMKRFPY